MITAEGRANIAANQSFKDGKQFAWDATSITMAEECLRKYYYQMIEGWRKKGKNVHLRFGGHYATALEHYHKHRALGLSVEDALYEVVREAMIDTWEYEYEELEHSAGSVGEVGPGERTSEGLPTPSSSPQIVARDGKSYRLVGGAPWDSGDTAKNRANLIRTIVWYIDQFADDPAQTIILANGKPAVELSFSIEVDNGIILAGHKDRLVNYADHIYVQDQKTTGTTITPRYFDGFSPNTQMSLYSFVGKMIYGQPISGVMIDAAQIMVGFSRFERGFTPRSATQLEEWYDSAMFHIEMARRATEAEQFPMNTTSCGNYGGCPFRIICSRPPSVRDNFLTGDFERQPAWDPLKRR